MCEGAVACCIFSQTMPTVAMSMWLASFIKRLAGAGGRP
jgi:hypothetical protein